MRRLAPVALAAVVALITGCGPSLPKGPRAPDAATDTPVDPVAVSAKQFAGHATTVLRDGRFDQQRLNLLAGVVQRQLRRSAGRFGRGHTDAGLASLTGALYLLRASELRSEMLAGGTAALRAGAAEVARSGNEGRAYALYTMLRTVLRAGPERDDVDAHLAALRDWTQATQSSGPMQSANAHQRMAVDRALYESTLPALNSAREATMLWIRRALTSGIVEQPITSAFEREEAIAAYRAIHSGGIAFVGLHLRHGDAVGAYTAVEQSELARIIPPALLEPLERAAMDNDPVAWADLFRLYHSEQDVPHPQLALDPELAQAAAWGAALELYRTNPRRINRAKPLATLLPAYGMAEVAPVVLARALPTQPSASDVSFCLGLVLQAMITEDRIGELASARRAFAGAAPILKAADAPRLAGQVQPSATRVRYVMGALETRAGELARARPHIEAVVASEPELGALRLLAAIERQAGNADAALDALQRSAALARVQQSPLDATEIWLTIFEIHRDRANPDHAATALRSALDQVLVARRLARNTPGQARAERLLGRVLEHYGDLIGARRATDRAYDASGSDLLQVAATVLDASRRALTHDDLQQGRDAVRRAIEAGLDDEDVVYVALWLRLLERRLKQPGDGMVEEALSAMQTRHGWPGRLRAWGRDKLTDAGLVKAARNRVERTEALFYTAMIRQAAEGGEAGVNELQQVATSEAIELVEVTMARDLLARRKAPLKLELPTDVKLP